MTSFYDVAVKGGGERGGEVDGVPGVVAADVVKEGVEGLGVDEVVVVAVAGGLAGEGRPLGEARPRVPARRVRAPDAVAEAEDDDDLRRVDAHERRLARKVVRERRRGLERDGARRYVDAVEPAHRGARDGVQVSRRVCGVRKQTHATKLVG